MGNVSLVTIFISFSYLLNTVTLLVTVDVALRTDLYPECVHHHFQHELCSGLLPACSQNFIKVYQ